MSARDPRRVELREREREGERERRQRSRRLNREEIECSSNIEEDSGFARIVSIRPLSDSSGVHRLPPTTTGGQGFSFAANAFHAGLNANRDSDPSCIHRSFYTPIPRRPTTHNQARVNFPPRGFAATTLRVSPPPGVPRPVDSTFPRASASTTGR